MEEKITVYVSCHVCREDIELHVYEKDVEEYMSPNRRHIQDIFPYLSAPERELLLSHICPDCWHDMFDDDNEEEEEGK